jgi:hypothetical protein
MDGVDYGPIQYFEMDGTTYGVVNKHKVYEKTKTWERWYDFDGVLHRDAGVAHSEEYGLGGRWTILKHFKHGLKHNENGPAWEHYIKTEDGNKKLLSAEYWVNGVSAEYWVNGVKQGEKFDTVTSAWWTPWWTPTKFRRTAGPAVESACLIGPYGGWPDRVIHTPTIEERMQAVTDHFKS